MFLSYFKTLAYCTSGTFYRIEKEKIYLLPRSDVVKLRPTWGHLVKICGIFHVLKHDFFPQLSLFALGSNLDH